MSAAGGNVKMTCLNTRDRLQARPLFSVSRYSNPCSSFIIPGKVFVFVECKHYSLSMNYVWRRVSVFGNLGFCTSCMSEVSSSVTFSRSSKPIRWHDDNGFLSNSRSLSRFSLCPVYPFCSLSSLRTKWNIVPTSDEKFQKTVQKIANPAQRVFGRNDEIICRFWALEGKILIARS